ncbi:MAG: AAA family ATPase [Burkholderiales bacterium]|nr:AAA family ATPase [Burkholderiales bacterium]
MPWVALCYHLATGVLPFADTDPLGLIHAHLARAPRPQLELASWLPRTLSDLILDLLAKEPDLRYQSAAGVAADLRLCAQQLALGEPLDAVVRRQNDRMLSPRPPRRLYGRAAEIDTLHASFAKAVRGGAQVLLVKGYSGVGKTSLVHEIHSQVTVHKGFFISGKFDQFLSQPFWPRRKVCASCASCCCRSQKRPYSWRQLMGQAVGADAAAPVYRGARTASPVG